MSSISISSHHDNYVSRRLTPCPHCNLYRDAPSSPSDSTAVSVITSSPTHSKSGSSQSKPVSVDAQCDRNCSAFPDKGNLDDVYAEVLDKLEQASLDKQGQFYGPSSNSYYLQRLVPHLDVLDPAASGHLDQHPVSSLPCDRVCLLTTSSGKTDSGSPSQLMSSQSPTSWNSWLASSSAAPATSRRLSMNPGSDVTWLLACTSSTSALVVSCSACVR